MTKAAIIAVGTELTRGEIVNRNAAWISEHLTSLGILVSAHRVVADDVDKIHRDLEDLSMTSEVVIVTGGLGPTLDDRTRIAVARWLEEPLEFNQESWQRVEEFFAQRGRQPVEENKRQCEFPRGASIIANCHGTADAFIASKAGCLIIALPGPPREISGLWQDEIETVLKQKFPHVRPWHRWRWRTIGHGESSLAQLIEPMVRKAVIQLPDLSLSFRAHQPYVETKLEFAAESPPEILTMLRQQVTTALRPWLYEQDDEDVANELLRQLGDDPVALHDGATDGYLLDLLAPAIRCRPPSAREFSGHVIWDPQPVPVDVEAYAHEFLTLQGSPDDAETTLVVSGYSVQKQWALGLRYRDEIIVERRESLYTDPSSPRRNQQAIAALAIKGWLTQIATLPSKGRPGGRATTQNIQ